MNQIAAAVLVGVLVAGGIYGWQVIQPPEPYVPPPPPEPDNFAWTFEPVCPVATHQVSQTFAVLHRNGTPADVEADEAWQDVVTATNDTLVWNPMTAQWLAPRIAELTCAEQHQHIVGHGPDGLGVGGAWTANLTVYIFLEDGTLVASNAADANRFEKSGDYIKLPGGPIYLGEGEGNGTALPILRAEARELLLYVEEGSTKTTVVAEHPYDWYLGTLYVSVRVDEIA